MESAILVDAENTSCWQMAAIMNKILEKTNVSIRRIYGDFTKPELINWKQVSLEHGFVTVQQYSYVSKKGTSDQKLTIDALKLLYEKKVNEFYIITSDSDFLPLCFELREQGKSVCGIGKRQTPSSFVKGCTDFHFIETLQSDNEEVQNESKSITKDILKDFIMRFRRDDRLINLGFLKEKLIQNGFQLNMKMKNVLLEFSTDFGIFQDNSTAYAYIR